MQNYQATDKLRGNIMKSENADKPEDVRILGQIQAEILALNDKCPDEEHRGLMRTMVLSATKLLLYRLRELYGASNPDGTGSRRDNSKSTEPK